MEEKIRVRFAPSPTGLLHVGNVRTALFNYLFARQTGGIFILRLENTDAARSTAEAEAGIYRDLRWLGLDWDEGPERGGAFGPYRQSERLDIYRRLAEALRESGKAYPCYCPEEELAEKRRASLAKGIPPRYDGRCRRLSPADKNRLAGEGRPASFRFRVEARHISFEDRVKGRMSFDGRGVGDFVLLRSDGSASYNFAAAVDDHLMEVTDVIRGEDHLANTPRQILLYQALGFPPPRFAHLPLILGPDRTPLGKRHGAVSVGHFREEGVLPAAFANYLALLGWSPEEGREILPLADLVRKFSLKRVSRSAAVFDLEKLKWVNREHLKEIPGARALELSRPFLERSGLPLAERDPKWLAEAVAAVWGEIDSLSQVPDRLRVFWESGFRLSPQAEALLAEEQSRRVVAGMAEEIEKVPEITAENYRRLAAAVGAKLGLSGKVLFLPLRAALTGELRGLELEKIFVLLGKEIASRRLRALPPQAR
jgi:nondiscriminating glutamyl-tRNA synthetase